jgi:hypothetical protein
MKFFARQKKIRGKWEDDWKAMSENGNVFELGPDGQIGRLER